MDRSSAQQPDPEVPELGRVDEHGEPTQFPSSTTPSSSSSLRPFFTLVRDTNTSRYYHPDVRYIFSDDDDSNLITDAALQSLESERAAETPSAERPRPFRQKTVIQAGARPPAQERYIVLDVEPIPDSEQDPAAAAAPDAAETSQQQSHPRSRNFRVVSANSLTPSWAVLNAQISPAPAFDSSSNSPPSTQDGQEPSPVGGLMLKIEGTSGVTEAPAPPSSRQQGPRRRPAEEMMEVFEKRMAQLRQVVEAGEQEEERRSAQQQEQERIAHEAQQEGEEEREGGQNE